MAPGFEVGLFGCCTPVPLCCEGFWCPCIVFGRTTYRLKHDGSKEGYSCCNADCAALCALHAFGGWGWILQCIRRGEIRREYRLEPSCCGDCMASFCCHCCAIIQQEKEVIARTDGGVHNRGYQQQPNMAMPERY